MTTSDPLHHPPKPANKSPWHTRRWVRWGIVPAAALLLIIGLFRGSHEDALTAGRLNEDQHYKKISPEDLTQISEKNFNLLGDYIEIELTVGPDGFWLEGGSKSGVKRLSFYAAPEAEMAVGDVRITALLVPKDPNYTIYEETLKISNYSGPFCGGERFAELGR